MWSCLSWIYTSHKECHTGTDLVFAERDVWGFLAGAEAAKTLVFTPRHPLPFRLVISLNRSLSFSGSVHHSLRPLIISSGQRWQAVGCITLLFSSSFFFPLFPLSSTRSSCSLTYCSPPPSITSSQPQILPPDPHPKWESGRVSSKNKHSTICLIETFEVVNGVEPASKHFSVFPVGVKQQNL